jgi:release factor glutamine methyltransferase
LTVGEVLAAACEYLGAKGVATPRLDAELILSQALALTRLELYTSFDRPLAGAELDTARALVVRRGRREPLAYVLGAWGFRRLTLRTDDRALVPRPETETVVERALAAVAAIEAPRVVDVGTGAGAIALAIADEHPAALVTATDSSVEALALARENAERHGLAVEFVATDLLDGLAGPFDLVVSNPPYVSPEELAGLEPEVRVYEPRVALLDEGQTAELARAARAVLGPGGALVLECHADAAAAVASLLAGLGFEEVAVSRDLAGRERVVEGRRPASVGVERGSAAV